MAWTTPKTWVAGSALTAAELNTHVRDNENWLKDALATSGITSDTVLSQIKGALYGVQAQKSGSQSISSGSATALTFTTENFDSNTFHDNAVNTDRITIPAGGAGIYLIGCTATWASNSTGDRRLKLSKNALEEAACQDIRRAASGTTTTQGFTVTLQLAAADYIYVEAHQDSGGALDVIAGRFFALRIFAV